MFTQILMNAIKTYRAVKTRTRTVVLQLALRNVLFYCCIAIKNDPFKIKVLEKMGLTICKKVTHLTHGFNIWIKNNIFQLFVQFKV